MQFTPTPPVAESMFSSPEPDPVMAHATTTSAPKSNAYAVRVATEDVLAGQLRQQQAHAAPPMQHASEPMHDLRGR